MRSVRRRRHLQWRRKTTTARACAPPRRRIRNSEFRIWHHSNFQIPKSKSVGIPPSPWWLTVFCLVPAITVDAIVLGAASIVSSLFDARGHFAHRCARAWSWLILKTTGVRVAVEGLERVVPDTTYVFVSYHQSIYDIPVIFASVPYQLRIIAKESLARFPVLGWHLRRGGHLFVDRQHPDRAGILGRWRALVSEGLSLLIFAEGTRSWDGHVSRFKGGSFLLAIEAGLPIVPLAVIG